MCEVLLLYDETSFRNILIVSTCYPLQSDFHQKQHTVLYEPSEP
jgi:hypothetical protein